MRGKYLIPTLTALVCAVIAALWISGGINLSMDSEEYVEAARINRDYGGIPITYFYFPPLYPLLLSLFPDILLGAKILNVISFALTGFLTALLLEADVLSALLVVLLLALSPALQLVQTFAWSEPLFITLVVLFLYGVKVRSVITIGFAAGVACLQRYVGMMVLPVGLFAVWVMPRRSLRMVMLYLLAAGVPIGIWLVRNTLLGFGPMGPRKPSTLALGDAISAALGVPLVWLPLLLIAVVLATRVVICNRIIIPAAIYCLLHVLIVVYGATTTALDIPDQRLLAPVYIPLMLLATKGIQVVLKNLGWTRFSVRTDVL